MVYDKIAYIYDELMFHVDYDKWLKLIKRVIKKYLPYTKHPRILELGCGTGTLGTKLRKRYKTDFTDLSFNMCYNAEHKLISENLFCSDATSIPVKSATYDVLLFLYDGINYLNIHEYEDVAAEACRVLKPGGVFLFDITTEYNSMNFFRDFTDVISLDDILCKRHSYYFMDKRIQQNAFNIYFNDGREVEEIHRQNIYYPEEIIKRIYRDGLEIIGVWDNFSMQKYRKDSERIHFLLRKI